MNFEKRSDDDSEGRDATEARAATRSPSRTPDTTADPAANPAAALKDTDMRGAASSSAAGSDGAQPEADPAKEAERLSHRIEEIRDHLGGLVGELDHRWHGLNPLTALRRNPWPVVIAGAVLTSAIAGAVALHGARARRQRSWASRSHRLQLALHRATENPEQVARSQPSFGMKLLTAAGTAAAAVVARRVATRMFARPS